jgi:hypothetical protein
VENYGELENLTGALGSQLHTDTSSGISVEGPEWHVQIVVAPQAATSEQNDKIRETLGEDADFLLLNDINFTDLLTGEAYHPGSVVKVRMPVPDQADYTTFTVVHISDDGQYTYIEAQVKDGYIEFEAQDFSVYGLVGFMETWEDIVPLAGSSHNLTWLWVSTAALAVCAFAVVLMMKKHRKNGREEDQAV